MDGAVLVHVDLICVECERCSADLAVGWVAHLVDLDDDGLDEVAFVCPRCAAREFGGGQRS